MEKSAEAIEVVRQQELAGGPKTPGVTRRKAFDKGGLVFAKTTIDPRNVSSWHHHGNRELFGYAESGRLTLDTEDGKSVQVSAGDFFHIPAGLVHRDVNPDDRVAVIVNVLLGEGELVVNVKAPA